jgi:hypothetical protein
MRTTSKPSPADIDDELQRLVDQELGHPRRRSTAPGQTERDRQAVHAIGYALRSPGWDSALLEDIVQLIRATGRQVSAPPLEVLRD